MKIQDLGFVLIFLAVLWIKNSRIATLVGLLCLLLAMPLFAFWIFFTAQRLVIYGAGFFMLSIVLNILHNSSFWQAKRVQNHLQCKQILDKPE